MAECYFYWRALPDNQAVSVYSLQSCVPTRGRKMNACPGLTFEEFWGYLQVNQNIVWTVLVKEVLTRSAALRCCSVSLSSIW